MSFWRVWLPKMQFKLWNGPQSCLENINNDIVHKVGMDKYQQWNGPQSRYGQIWGIKIKWCQFERYDDPNLKDVILKGMTTEK